MASSSHEERPEVAPVEVEESSWSGPTCSSATWSKPASLNVLIAATWSSGSGPQAMTWVMSSSPTVRVAAAKLSGVGSSDITFQPVTANRWYSMAVCTALSRSSAQHTATCPYLGPSPPALV